MTPLWTAPDIAAATGGTVHGDFSVRDVVFDSREVIGGELFVAMPGTVTDGHAHISHKRIAARRVRAAGQPSRPMRRTFCVPDTAAALTALAIAARARMTGTVVGVTGSVGKTGTKEALAAAFARQGPDRAHRSVKSYNNHTGVPLSLARMPADSAHAVFEMGMNHAGELAALTRLVRPHIALITWVASAHRAAFASEEAIADAKAEIFEGLEPGGTAVLPRDNPHYGRLHARAAAHAARVLTFGEDATPTSALSAPPQTPPARSWWRRWATPRFTAGWPRQAVTGCRTHSPCWRSCTRPGAT